jgi:hypothetical protein
MRILDLAPDPTERVAGPARRAPVQADVRAQVRDVVGVLTGAGLMAPEAPPEVPELPPGRAVALLPGVHEWFDEGSGRGMWWPPLAVLADLAWRAVAGDGGPGAGGTVVWVGRRCWPYVHTLLRREPGGGDDRRLLERSVFVDPPGRAEGVWAVDLALRCAGIAAVIADGRGLTMAESRRLQLAAGAGGTPAMLARPGAERRALSAARARWLVAPAPAGARGQAWTIELLRCKGMRPASGGASRWAARRDHATGVVGEWAACDVGLAAGVAGRSAAEAGPKIA